MSSVSIKLPEYFHREYANDVGITTEQTSILGQCKRVALVALPFISLYKPAGFSISLGMGSCRAISDAVKLYSAAQEGTRQEVCDQLIRTAVSTMSIACTIVAHPVGMLVSTGHDLAIEAFLFAEHVQKGDYCLAAENAANIVNNALYLCMFISGGLELSIASLSVQVLLGLYHSRKELLKGNYLEAAGHLGMAMIRGNQLLGQVHTLQLRWEAQARLEAQKIADLKKMRTNIEDLQKKLLEETAKLEELQKETSTELSNNAELLELQKVQLAELQKRLQEAQRLQDILLFYGNNKENLSAFHCAIKQGDKEAVELMLVHGVDVNSITDRRRPDVFGITALHQAALSGQIEIVDLLLRYGADINALSDHHNCQLGVIHYAAQSGRADVINCLIRYGVDVNMSSSLNKPKTALHVAAELGNFDAIVALVNGGADVNKGRVPGQYSDWLRDREGGPLDIAVQSLRCSDNLSNLEVIRFLVEHGAQRRYQQYEYISCPIIKAYLQSVNR